MLIYRNAEGVHAYLSKWWRSACLFFELLKGYMLICRNAEGVHGKKRLGTPGLELLNMKIEKW